MTVYKDPTQINRFIKQIPENWGIYIHIDKKSNIDKNDINSKAITCKLKKINWGAREHIEAFLTIMNKAYNDNKYDYYHLVTGQDYICKPITEIETILGKEQKNYIEFFKIPHKTWTFWNQGYDIVQYRTLASFINIKSGRNWNINKKIELLQSKLRLKRALPKYDLYGGSVYCTLHKSAIQYILNSKITEDLFKRLKHSCCGEELFFQTILMNSPLKDTLINNNLRYIDWADENPPKILNESDYNKIINSGKIFCRKVENGELIERLDYISRT